MKKDFHDYEYLEREKAQIGQPGENGQAVFVSKEEEDSSRKVRKINWALNFIQF